MADLEKLRQQHLEGHGPSRICGGPTLCTSARYLQIIEELLEKIETLKVRLKDD